ncbi:FKBP-type peptidyl-prolyl cis-trans isomerase [Acidiferrimicrobium sp. IK]|uniref:FKBP-type peptidyl-prolyl cis-trans isomerase n=1 Tax=Acidiferrimicrobium sp. IK TaxID=2871700 RepID=UPI0021CB1113|nr:FKBP-type peptidyl-prolyl cis-trans isomerase [Acidiferrimicrobium sp. IK]
MPRRACPAPRRPTAVLLGALALAAAACGSSSATTANSGATTTAPAVAAPAANQFTSGAVPAADGATDMKAAPTLHAGTGTAPTTLVGKDLVVGTGPVASATSTVNIQYVGALYTTGQVFDSSWTRGQPASFSLSQVIPGFAQGIVGMKVGGRRELVIPPALGYGNSAQGSIPANSTLVFVIDLLGVS